MPTVQFQPLLGRHITITLTGITVDALGNITNGTSYGFSGRFQDYSVDYEAEEDDISPSDSTGKNWVTLSDDYSFTVSEINKLPNSTPSYESQMAEFVNNYVYGLITISSANVSGKTYTGYVKKSRFRLNGQGKGRRVAEGTFRQILISSANPTYA